MTWVVFTRNYSHSTTRYTEHFKEGERRNLPRHVAEAIVNNGGAKMEATKREKKRTNAANVSETATGE